MNILTIAACTLLHFSAPRATSLKSDTSFIDTTKYAVIPLNQNRDKYRFDASSTPTKLYATEIKKIEKIIRKWISELNDLRSEMKKIKEIDKEIHKGNYDKSKIESIKNDPLIQDNVISNPGKYYKQFVAVINSKGEKEVWVECFCKISDASWKTEPVIVKDGGNCYFYVKINLTTGLVSNFGINSNS
jgi:hypothetical protein